jgi:hypothetical protein
VVELVAALPTGVDQPRALEDVEVLGDGLPRGAQAVLGDQPGAQLKQRLAVPVEQLAHQDRIGKYILA